MSLKNVILSGGVGSRLWPLSRKARPKQYIPLFAGQSLFDLTLQRNLEVCSSTIVVGGRDNYLLSRESLKKSGVSDYFEIVEATPRNTAAAIAFAAFAADSEDILLVTPSDHIINDQLAYLECINDAAILAESGNLVTFGINPTKPETGYGYIEFSGNSVLSFREKPNKQEALEFISKGKFLWNSGIFCFKAGSFLRELEALSPEIYRSSLNAWANRADEFLPEEDSFRIPSLSVDYAVMEKSKLIKVIPSDFGWSDLGSFDAIWEHCDKKRDQFYFNGTNLILGTSKRVEILGVENAVIVETEDALLVVHRDSSQGVKKIYERLELDNPKLT